MFITGLQYIHTPKPHKIPQTPRRSRPAFVGYPTSEFHEKLLNSFYKKSRCPKGFTYKEDEECEGKSIYQ